MKKISKLLALLLAAILSLSVFAGCTDAAYDLMESLESAIDSYESDTPSDTDGVTEQQPQAPPADNTEEDGSDADKIDVNGFYTSPEEVAAYINAYGKLPSNFITKNDARDLGWDSSKGNLHSVAPGKSIGGDRFGNYEGLLPKASGRTYYECDVNYKGGYRGSERIVFSNDGLIYYTADHYETFTLLYKDGVKQ